MSGVEGLDVGQSDCQYLNSGASERSAFLGVVAHSVVRRGRVEGLPVGEDRQIWAVATAQDEIGLATVHGELRLEGVLRLSDAHVDDVAAGAIALGYPSVKVVREGYEGLPETRLQIGLITGIGAGGLGGDFPGHLGFRLVIVDQTHENLEAVFGFGA